MPLILNDKNFQFCLDAKEKYDADLKRAAGILAQNPDASFLVASLHKAKKQIAEHERELKNELRRLCAKWLIE